MEQLGIYQIARSLLANISLWAVAGLHFQNLINCSLDCKALWTKCLY